MKQEHKLRGRLLEMLCFYNNSLCVCACGMHVHEDAAYDMSCVWKSEGNLYHVGFANQTDVFGLVSNHL